MQLALRAISSGHEAGSSAAARVNKFLVGGVSVAAAAAIVVNPLAPTMTANLQRHLDADVQHRAVRLTSGIDDVLGDYQSVLSQAGTNLQTLSNEAAVAIPALLQAINTNLSTVSTDLKGTSPQALASAVQALIPAFFQGVSTSLSNGTLISTALSGAKTSLQNALNGGWYGGDDGYVFGLFGGTVTHNGVTETGSTLQEISTALQQGDTFSAFSYAEEWSLEVLDHTLKPLLSPILNTAKPGATPSETIEGDVLKALTNVAETLPTPVPAEVLHTVTNLTASVLSYSNLKTAADAILAPALSVAFGLVGDLTTFGTDVFSGKFGSALKDVLKAPADLVGDLLNGYVYHSAAYNPTNAPFTGLLNSGSLLQNLVQTWPNQIATAVKLTTATSTAAIPAASAVTADVTKLSTPATTSTTTTSTAAVTPAAATPATAAKTTNDTKHGWGRRNATTTTDAASAATDATSATTDPAGAKSSDAPASHGAHHSTSTSSKDSGGTRGHGKHSEAAHATGS